MAERFKAPVLKTGECNSSVSSNLTLSAIFKSNTWVLWSGCFFLAGLPGRLIQGEALVKARYPVPRRKYGVAQTAISGYEKLLIYGKQAI